MFSNPVERETKYILGYQRWENEKLSKFEELMGICLEGRGLNPSISADEWKGFSIDRKNPIGSIITIIIFVVPVN